MGARKRERDVRGPDGLVHADEVTPVVGVSALVVLPGVPEAGQDVGREGRRTGRLHSHECPTPRCRCPEERVVPGPVGPGVSPRKHRGQRTTYQDGDSTVNSGRWFGGKEGHHGGVGGPRPV